MVNWKRDLDKQYLKKARARLGTLSDDDLVNSIPVLQHDISQFITAWRRGGGQPAIDGAYVRMLVTLETLRTLEERHPERSGTV